MVKLNISSDSYAGAPFGVLPFVNLESLNSDSLGMASIHSLSEETRTHFLKTAGVMEKCPPV